MIRLIKPPLELDDVDTKYTPRIIDPRIGTRFPNSLKEALEELAAEWK
jgi:hypothetical protein